MTIYADIILDHYHYPRNNTSLIEPTATVDVENPLCGDSLHMEVKVENSIIKEIGYTGEGCAIAIASASILSEYALGKDLSKLVDVKRDDMLGLLHIELTPNRVKCALLSWEALMKLISISK